MRTLSIDKKIEKAQKRYADLMTELRRIERAIRFLFEEKNRKLRK